MAERIKGQETEILLIKDNVQQDSLRAVESFDVEFQLDVTSVGFLGELADRKDETFTGVAGSLSLQLEDKGVFKFVDEIVQRAQSRTPGVQVNAKASFSFPNGDRPRFMFFDLRFSAIPFSFGGRTEHGTMKLDFECSSYKLLGA